jgi:pimeloyl-ACP methyl ester carboxylesterase
MLCGRRFCGRGRRPDVLRHDALLLVDERELHVAGVVNLLGSWLGGYLVQAVALQQPRRVNQLIIANGFYDPMLETPDDDPGRVALKTVMHALVGPVQSAENYRSRTLLLASAGALERPDVPDERVMVIDDDREPDDGCRDEKRAA